MPASQHGRNTPNVVAIIPSRHAVTGGMVADLEILEQLRARGWSIEVIALDAVWRPKRLPALFLGIWLNVVLVLRVANLPRGVILLEDQALALHCLVLNVAARRLHGARVCLLAYHLVTGLWRNPLRRAAGRLFDKLGAKTAQRIFASSASTATQLEDLGVPAAKVVQITLGAGPSRAPDMPLRAVRNNGTPKLLTVGTVEPRKGLQVLLSALADIQELPWHLDVAGLIDPIYFRTLARGLNETGLTDRVHFRGRVSNETLNALMIEADIFVHPSLWEGFGLVLVEAMKYGLPIVSTSAGSVPELLQHGHTGLLVPPGEVEALSGAIRRLITESELRRSLGRRAALHVTGKYTWEDTGRQVDAALRVLTAKHGSSGTDPSR